MRLIVTDVDGTLTDRDRRMDLGAVAALRLLADRGFPVVFATGNVLPMVLGVHRFLGLKAPLVAENGGLVYFGEDRVVRLARREVALAAMERAARTLPVQPLFTDRWRETEVALQPNLPVEDVRAAVAGMGVVVEATGFAIHLFEPTGGKLRAVELVLRELGVPWEQVLALGDGDNDVEVLERAGYSVSFPDGSPRARASADLVTSGAGGSGFVEALRTCRILPAL